jgi:hypothetical protein
LPHKDEDHIQCFHQKKKDDDSNTGAITSASAASSTVLVYFSLGCSPRTEEADREDTKDKQVGEDGLKKVDAKPLSSCCRCPCVRTVKEGSQLE